MKKEIVLVLHNIRSAHNVGSIFRTADAAGVTKIYLSGYSPRPADRFGRPQKEIGKTALGAEAAIPWEYFKTATPIFNTLEKQGFQVIGLEQSPSSVDYKKVKPKYPVAFVVGNEVKGMSPELQKRCDIIAEIPMKGEKESLNVGVSLGIALFRILGI